MLFNQNYIPVETWWVRQDDYYMFERKKKDKMTTHGDEKRSSECHKDTSVAMPSDNDIAAATIRITRVKS